MKRRSKRGTGKLLKPKTSAGRNHKQESKPRAPARKVGAQSRCHSPDISVHEKAKTSPVQILESAIATRRNSQTELSGLGQSLAEKSARLAALEITGNLQDPEVLTELVHLQISTGLLPRRIAVKEECDVNAEQALIQATNQFIREHLGPRVRRLAARTRVIVNRELSSHFADPSALLVAVEKSEQVRTIESLSWAATVQPQNGALAHAAGALNAWAAVDKFETTLERGPHASRV